MALQRKSGQVEYFNRQNSNLPSNNIYSIISDENGGLWVASLEHLLHFDIDKLQFYNCRQRIRMGVNYNNITVCCFAIPGDVYG